MRSIATLFLLTLTLPFLFISCEAEDTPGTQVTFLLISERNKGTVSIIDLETGNLSELGVFIIGEDTLVGIRSMVYNSNTNRIYAGQNSNDGGAIHEINVKSMEGIVINDNLDDQENPEWFGLSGLTILSNGDIGATTWNRDIVEPVITSFTTDGTRNTDTGFGPGGPCCGMGLTTLNDNYLVGDFRQFHEIDNTGAVINTTVLTGSFTPAIELTATFVQNLTWIDGVLYTLLADQNNGTTFVASLNPDTGELTQLTDGLTGRYHGLAAVPDLAFR